MSKLADCRCARWPGNTCCSLATQEDLLCDACRGRRCSLVKIGGHESFHTKIIDLKLAPAGWKL